MPESLHACILLGDYVHAHTMENITVNDRRQEKGECLLIDELNYAASSNTPSEPTALREGSGPSGKNHGPRRNSDMGNIPKPAERVNL